MKILALPFLMLACAFAQVPLCGFDVLATRHAQSRGVARMEVARQGTCTPEQLDGPVIVDTTRHFRVIYTRSGPHAVLGSSETPASQRPPFIDTLMVALEQAWTLHVDSIGMRPPVGPDTSHHYRSTLYPEKFPVEVIDLDLMRNTYRILGGICGPCYGLTLPTENGDRSRTTLLIENDFLYQNVNDANVQWTTPTGTCTYTPSTIPLTVTLEGQTIDYRIEWARALRITVFHELYHTCQLRYQDYDQNYHFWFEASATGVENLGVPTVDDYFQYLPTILSHPDRSLSDMSDQMHPYGEAVFYHDLAHRFGKRFDSGFWTRLGDNPLDAIEASFAAEFVSRGIPGGLEQVFADHARHLFGSGARSRYLVADSIWTPDLHRWPSLALSSWPTDQLSLSPFAFRLYAADTNIIAWTPPAGSGLRKTLLRQSDSTFALVIAGAAPKPVKITQGSATVQVMAWPNPWRGVGTLCFAPPTGDTRVELRSAAGVRLLDLQLPQSHAQVCTDGTVQGKPLAPGLYHWRGNSEQRLHSLLVIR